MTQPIGKRFPKVRYPRAFHGSEVDRRANGDPQPLTWSQTGGERQALDLLLSVPRNA
jgi:hypothetical protein